MVLNAIFSISETKTKKRSVRTQKTVRKKQIMIDEEKLLSKFDGDR